jgi:hypothetical protein
MGAEMTTEESIPGRAGGDPVPEAWGEGLGYPEWIEPYLPALHDRS